MKKQTIAQEYKITGRDGKPFTIPIRGSIPLLALGYRGLMAWRAKRIEADKMQKKNQGRENAAE